MSFTQWRVQLFSSVASCTPRLIIHSCEWVSECTLKAHWLSTIAPSSLITSSLGLSLANELALSARPRIADIVIAFTFISQFSRRSLLQCSEMPVRLYIRLMAVRQTLCAFLHGLRCKLPCTEPHILRALPAR